MLAAIVRLGEVCHTKWMLNQSRLAELLRSPDENATQQSGYAISVCIYSPSGVSPETSGCEDRWSPTPALAWSAGIDYLISTIPTLPVDTGTMVRV